MSRFSTEAIRKYRKTFDIFDVDGDGSINEKELRQVATKLGYQLSDRQIANIMRSRDLDNNGSLSFEEFLNAMPGNMVDIPEEDHKDAEVRLKFLEYDKDGNGLVNAAEAHAILKKELFFTPSQTMSLLNIYDRNKDGHLNYEEFVRFYRRVKTSKQQIRHLFEQCDLDKDGSVTLEEIKAVLKRCNLPDDDVDTLLAIHDKNKDGRLQYHEFVQFLLDGEF